MNRRGAPGIKTANRAEIRTPTRPPAVLLREAASNAQPRWFSRNFRRAPSSLQRKRHLNAVATESQQGRPYRSASHRLL